ncbi:hypothetical protein DUPY_04650 [Duganella phyllosphaerae]|uniref:Uncharacterized protein n=1 Tax=Duganella phyllosphaerae TaxID=762836 RepID=A0A1E7X743_9BURK|nr:hypothetical protein DUPY_04650 [Duganella phyllosphaerae]
MQQRQRILVAEGNLAGGGRQRHRADLSDRAVAAPDHAHVAHGRQARGDAVVRRIAQQQRARSDGRVLGPGQQAADGLDQHLGLRRRLARQADDVAVTAEQGQEPRIDEDGIDIAGRDVEGDAARHQQRVAAAALEVLPQPLQVGLAHPVAERHQFRIGADVRRAHQHCRQAIDQRHRLGRKRRQRRGLRQLLRRRRVGQQGPVACLFCNHVHAASAALGRGLSWVSLQPRTSARATRPCTRSVWPSRPHGQSSTPTSSPTSSVSRLWPG